jgi:NitT/TauT family transport system permease protein
MDTPLMFAVLALITVQGLLLYHGVVWLQQFLLRRYVAPSKSEN